MKRHILTIAVLLLLTPGAHALTFSKTAENKAAPPVKHAPPAASVATAKLLPAPKQDPQSLLARVTVYWARGGSGSDRYTRQHKCATGMRLRTGHCAVDPRKIPYGSRVVFPNGESLAAVDTGTAVINRKAARKAGRTVSEKSAVVIDRFFETKKQALAWANTHPPFMPVRIVTPNSHSFAEQRPGQGQRYPRAQAVVSSITGSGKPSSAANDNLVAASSAGSRNPLIRSGH